MSQINNPRFSTTCKGVHQIVGRIFIDNIATTSVGQPTLKPLCAGAWWPSGLERWTGDRTVQGSNPTAENFSLRNFGNSVYPSLPVSFGGDTKSRRSLLSGVYARGSKRSHRSALECVTVVDYIAHSKLPQKCVYAAENAALHWKRRRRRRSWGHEGRLEELAFNWEDGCYFKIISILLFDLKCKNDALAQIRNKFEESELTKS